MIPPARERGQVLERRGIKSFVNSGRRLRLALELLLAGALIAWRCVARTWHPFYLDIFFYLGVYWIFLALAPRESKARTPVAVLMCLGLLALYLKAQVPHMMVVAELLP